MPTTTDTPSNSDAMRPEARATYHHVAGPNTVRAATSGAGTIRITRTSVVVTLRPPAQIRAAPAGRTCESVIATVASAAHAVMSGTSLRSRVRRPAPDGYVVLGPRRPGGAGVEAAKARQNAPPGGLGGPLRHVRRRSIAAGRT